MECLQWDSGRGDQGVGWAGCAGKCAGTSPVLTLRGCAPCVWARCCVSSPKLLDERRCDTALRLLAWGDTPARLRVGSRRCPENTVKTPYGDAYDTIWVGSNKWHKRVPDKAQHVSSARPQFQLLELGAEIN